MLLRRGDKATLGLIYNLAKIASPLGVPTLSVFSLFANDFIARLAQQGYEIHVCKIEPVPFTLDDNDAG
jgi:hypothetical protein